MILYTFQMFRTGLQTHYMGSTPFGYFVRTSQNLSKGLAEWVPPHSSPSGDVGGLLKYLTIIFIFIILLLGFFIGNFHQSIGENNGNFIWHYLYCTFICSSWFHSCVSDTGWNHGNIAHFYRTFSCHINRRRIIYFLPRRKYLFPNDAIT